MTSGQNGGRPPTGQQRDRSPALLPLLAFIVVVALAFGAVLILRQVLPAQPAAATKGTPSPTSRSGAPAQPTPPAGAAQQAGAAPTAVGPTAPKPVLPPTAVGLPATVYAFYDWQNTNFAEKYPQAGAIGSLAVFAWGKLHTGPGQYDWSSLDRYLAQAAAMTVTLQSGVVISKPIILEITENESEAPSKQIEHKAADGLSARFVYHDYTPTFVRRQISAQLARPITYTNADGSLGRINEDGGSYLADIAPGASCQARTVAIVPKYDNPTWQKYYKEFVAALGERYKDQPQIVALVFGPGIDQEYGQATKDYQGCALRSELYKLVSENAYLDAVIKEGDKNDLAHAWRAAFPSKPLYLQFTSAGKDRVDTLAAAGIFPPIGLKQATLTFDNNNQFQTNGHGTVQLMQSYSATLPIAWENAYDQTGAGAESTQNRYFSVLLGLSSFPTYMDFTARWIDELGQNAAWLLDFTRTYLGRSIAKTDEVWVAMRGTEHWPASPGAVGYAGWRQDAAYGLYRLGQASLLRKSNLPAAVADHPYSLMARRTDKTFGGQMGLQVDRRWAFWKQQPLAVDPRGVSYDITVKYLDAGTDAISLRYQDASGAARSATINKANSNAWVTTTVALADAYLAGGLADGADLILDADLAQGGPEEIIHMVMIKAKQGAPSGVSGGLAAAVPVVEPTPQIVDRQGFVAQERSARSTAVAATAVAATKTPVPTQPPAAPPAQGAASPTPSATPGLPVLTLNPTPISSAATDAGDNVGVQFAPAGKPTIPPVYYAFYEWRNINFTRDYPEFPAIGAQPVFGWEDLHVAPGQYNWALIDTYLRDAAAMTVTVGGNVISKPIILEITANESEIYSTQIAHDPNYANGRDPWAARMTYHDYTPAFVKQQMNAPLLRPITYATTAGQLVTLTNDGGSYMADVLPGVGGCITRTVAFVPKYNNPTWQTYYKQFVAALGARYNNNPQIVAVVMGGGIDEEYGHATKEFFECSTKGALYSSLMSEYSYLETFVKGGANNDVLDAYRAAFPSKPVLLQFTSNGKDRADLAMAQGYAYPVGLKQATLTYDNNNQYQTNNAGTLQIMDRYSQTTYIGWENAYAFTGGPPQGRQIRYFTLLAGLQSFPDYMDFIGGWVIDYDMLDAGILHFVQPYLGRTITNTDEVWVALRDTDHYPWTGGAIKYGGWHDDFTYGLHRNGPESNINNPVIKRDQMGAAPYNIPQTTRNHMYSLIARRTDHASGNDTMSFYTDPRWGYYNKQPKAVNSASGAWYDVTLKYINKGRDTISLSYMDYTGMTRTLTINKTDTSDWITTTVVLNDAVWSHSMAGGADLILNADPQNGGVDEIVHMAMIKGHTGGAPTPTPLYSPTPKPTRTPTRTPVPGQSTPTKTPVGQSTPSTPQDFSELYINAGGDTYTDGAGKTWIPDQSYAPGSWGYYVGGIGGVYNSPITVTNTSDPHIYQSERYFGRAEGGYVFDVPEGRYEVEMKFAEIFGREPGKRVFDVQIEGVTVLDDFDVAAQAGINTALDRTFLVNVNDGQLSIALTPITDSAKINALRVSAVGVPTRTPTATVTPGGPTSTATATATATGTRTPTATPPGPTNTATATLTPGAPTVTPTRTGTATATASPTQVRTPTQTATPIPVPTLTPTATATPDPALDGRVIDLERRYLNLLNLVTRLIQILSSFGSLQ